MASPVPAAPEGLAHLLWHQRFSAGTKRRKHDRQLNCCCCRCCCTTISLSSNCSSTFRIYILTSAVLCLFTSATQL